MSTVLNGTAVLERLMLISGLNATEAQTYLSSCTYELTRIIGRLKEGINADDYADGLILAAAAQVSCTVAAMRMLSNESEFSVGDVSVKNGFTAKAERAEAFKRDAFASIADILTDDGFAFVGAGG